jgi:hypothetical protein
MMVTPSPPNTAPGSLPAAPATKFSRIPMYNGHADGGMFVTYDSSPSILHVTSVGKQSPI